MRDSIVEVGKQLPETREEYMDLARVGLLKYTSCQLCKLPHMGRTYGAAEWAETQISGACGVCFDGLFPDEEDDDAAD